MPGIRNVTIIFGVLLWCSLCLAQAPPRLVFFEDFDSSDEIDDLSDEIIRVNWQGMLASSGQWHQSFLRLPKSMRVGLKRGGAQHNTADGEQSSRRYLSIPKAGGNADLLGPKFNLQPGLHLRISVDLRWDRLGSGKFIIGIITGDQQRLPLIVNTGAAQKWARYSEDVMVPDHDGISRIALWIEGDPNEFGGDYGIDNLKVEFIPRLVVHWRGTVQRVEPQNDRPLLITSVGFPQGSYAFKFRVLTANGSELFEENSEKYIDGGLRQLNFYPRLRWSQRDLPRGLYSVRMTARSLADGWMVEDFREFALAGKSQFEYIGDNTRWGVVVGESAQAPVFLAMLEGRVRVVYPLGKKIIAEPYRDDSFPRWFAELGEFQRVVALDQSLGWVPEDGIFLQELYPLYASWIWRGDAKPGEAMFTKLREAAPYLDLNYVKTGREFAVGIATPLVRIDPLVVHSAKKTLSLLPRDRRYSVLLNPLEFPDGKTAEALARVLLLAATRNIRTVYIENPEAVLLRLVEGNGQVPTRSLLAWEFITGFLSKATFEGFEDWDSKGGICVIFKREGLEYLVVMGSSGDPHFLDLDAGSDAKVYNSLGTRLSLSVDELSITRIPVGADPLIISGLALDRVRTIKSLQLTGEPIKGGGVSETLHLKMKNNFQQKAKVSLDLQLPEAWGGELILSSQEVNSKAEAEWEFEVEVPKWYGIEQERYLVGEMSLQFEDGTLATLPLRLPIPVESSTVQIEVIDLNAKQGTLVVRNLQQRALEFTLYYDVRPGYEEGRFLTQRLDPGAERAYEVSFAAQAENEKRLLYVGVVLEGGSHINKTFEIPER